MAKIADIQISVSLIDDYLQLAKPPVAQNLPGRFLAVPDPAQQTPACLLTIDPSGNLLQFQPDQTSHSGWSTTSVEVPAPITATGPISRLAGFSQDGVINALAYFPVSGEGASATWLQSSAPGAWTAVNLGPDATNALAWTYQTDYYVDGSGNQFLYGVTGGLGSPGAFFLVGLYEGQWDVIYDQYINTFSPGISTGAAFRMLPGIGANQFTILWVDNGVIYYQGASIEYVYQDGAVVNANFEWSSEGPGQFNPGIGSFTASQIIQLPGDTAEGNLLVTDDQQRLWLFQDYNGASPSQIQLTGGSGQPGGVSQVEAVNASDNLAVFVTDAATGRLWILRQQGDLGSSAPFAPWVNLGNQLDAIACPLLSSGGPELFMVDMSATVFHMAQTASDHIWVTRKIAAPTPSTATPLNIAAVTMELTVVDANGAPTGNTVVSVSSDQATTIIVEDLSFQLAPNVPVKLPVDATGHLSVLTQTESLAAPVLTFSCYNEDGSIAAQRWCHGDVVQYNPGDPPPSPHTIANRLAGNDPTLPITQQSLTNANLLNKQYADPAGAVSAITSAGQYMQSHGQTPNTMDFARVAKLNWRVDFTDPGGPRFELLSPERSAQILEKSNDPSRARSDAPGSFLSFLGDVLNFFKHLWRELESIAVVIADEVKIIINDAETFIINTVREAASALETIFNKIAQAIKEVVDDIYDAILKVVDFLKMLFDWDNILNSHEIIKWSINQFVTKITSSTGDAQNWANQQIAGLQNEIDNGIAKLETHFQQQSFNDYVDATNQAVANPASGSSGHALAAQNAHTGYRQNAAQCKYIHSKAKAHKQNIPAPPPSLMPMSGVESIQAAIKTNWGNVPTPPKTSFTDSSTNTGSSTSNFFDSGITDTLTACEDIVNLVLEGVAAVADVILEAGGDALSELQSFWQTPLDIPVISWLYQHVITDGDTLTLLDLFSLILAVPATILYELFNGMPPFTSADVETYVNGKYAIPWPSFPTSAPAAAEHRLVLTEMFPTNTMGFFAGLADFINMFVNAGADLTADVDPPDPELATLESYASLFLTLASQILGAPWEQFAKPASERSTADNWTIALWAAESGTLVYESVFLIKTKKISRFTPDWGPVLDTLYGLALMGVAIPTLCYQADDSSYNGWDCANCLIPQFDRLFKFLLLSPDDPEAMAMLLAADVVFGVASTVTQIGSSIS